MVKRDDGTAEIEVGEGVDPYEIRLHLVRIGDVALYGFSGELYSSLGMRLKEISPLKNTVFINHDASLMARSHYIFDDKTLACGMAAILPGAEHPHAARLRPEVAGEAHAGDVRGVGRYLSSGFSLPKGQNQDGLPALPGKKRGR